MRVAVMLNPRSGTAATENQVREAFGRHGVECEIVELEGAEEDKDRACEAVRRSDVLVAAGGDGTVNAAATVLYKANSGAELGVIPMGTANDLSRSLGLPADLDTCAAVIVYGRSVPIDLITLANGRVMINQANGGFSGTVAQELQEEMKSRWGPFAYLRASVDVFTEMPDYELTMVVDGERLQVQALNLSVANAQFSGGGVPVAPEADYSDGLMDIMIVESRLKLAMLPLIPRILTGTHLGAEGIVYRRAKSLHLFMDPPMPFSIDGEPNDEHPSHFEVEPGRLRVRVPA